MVSVDDTSEELRAGELLRLARRERKLKIGEVAHVLRIPPEHLRALEEGDLSVFSADVYARGAYQKYARYLRVENQQSYHAFLRVLSKESERKPLRVPTPSRWFARIFTPYGVIGLGILLLVTLIAGYLGWQVFTFLRLPDLEITEPIIAVVESDTVLVRGVAEENTQVLVNKVPVLPGGSGFFEYELSLRPGINVLQVEAVGAFGRSRVLRRELLRLRQ